MQFVKIFYLKLNVLFHGKSGKFPTETNPDLSECEGRLGKRGGGRD